MGLLCFPLGGQGGPNILGQVACSPLPGCRAMRSGICPALSVGLAGRAEPTQGATPGQQRPRAPQARVTVQWTGVTQQRCLCLLTPAVTLISAPFSVWRAQGFLFHWLPKGEGERSGGESGRGGEGQPWPANTPLPKQAGAPVMKLGGGNPTSPVLTQRSGRAGWEEDANPGP